MKIYYFVLRILLALFLFFILSYELFSQNQINSVSEGFNPILNSDIFFKSNQVDFIQISSSVTEGVKTAVIIYKPDKPSPVLLTTHGWHGSVTPPTADSKNPYENFLTVQVDMRGRKYSSGKADCNGLELYDVYDAYKFVVENYSSFISDKDQVYFIGGSGGGGNGYAIIGKFPDLFCSAVISCGISDYAEWYRNDTLGEFRDEMLPWIGVTPDQNMEAYQSRSGITTVQNLLTSVWLIHGETDVRVPSSHARNFFNKAVRLNKNVQYLELKNVGTRNHWGNITKEQEEQKNEFTLKGLEMRTPPLLPAKGKFVVAGYVVTKKFSVFMDSIDKVGIIKYDINRKKIRFTKGHGQVIWY